LKKSEFLRNFGSERVIFKKFLGFSIKINKYYNHTIYWIIL
jgi:hypothetical protein